MLSDGDRRYLHEIEQRLEAEDLHLASALGALARPERWVRRAVDATIALSTVLAAVCLILPGAATMGRGSLPACSPSSCSSLLLPDPGGVAWRRAVVDCSAWSPEPVAVSERGPTSMGEGLRCDGRHGGVHAASRSAVVSSTMDPMLVVGRGMDPPDPPAG